VVRPGGLKDSLKEGEQQPGNVVMQGPGYYGFGKGDGGANKSGAILRRQVRQ
jgi:hypothetical protein